MKKLEFLSPMAISEVLIQWKKFDLREFHASLLKLPCTSPDAQKVGYIGAAFHLSSIARALVEGTAR
jgi:hypothetical protein